jgi:hypothetical protein
MQTGKAILVATTNPRRSAVLKYGWIFKIDNKKLPGMKKNSKVMMINQDWGRMAKKSFQNASRSYWYLIRKAISPGRKMSS